MAPEPPLTVFEDSRGPNVRVLRQEQRRLAPAELEALIAASRRARGSVSWPTSYGLHRTTVSRQVARAGKTRPVMTDDHIDEAVRLYAEGWTLDEVGRSIGVADQTVRRALVEQGGGDPARRSPGGRGGVSPVAGPSRYDVTTT